MSNVPNAWDDDWSATADHSAAPPDEAASKKVSSKVSKAQRRAQQAEFNKQLWAEAEGPKDTNFFLESRNVVPLRQEYKAPPILLSRKGPIVQTSKPPTDGIENLNLRAESSDDEEATKATALSLAERQAQAAKDREEKQRKYEERRQELFGTTSNAGRQTSKGSNGSSPNLTPPNSRSSTPNRGRGRGKRGGVNQSLNRPQQRELFNPTYTPKPDSVYMQRRSQGVSNARSDEVHPIREPRGPDGTGRGGFGFTRHNPVLQHSVISTLTPLDTPESG